MPNDLLGSVRRTLRILNYLAQTAAGASPRAIAIATDSNISTVYHVLNTLTTDGYAKRNETTGLYRLGHKIAPLGHTLLKGLSPPPPIQAVLCALSEATKTHAYLTRISDGELIVADIVKHDRCAPQMPYLGYSAHFHALSMGKATLAYCRPPFVREHFASDPPVALTKRTLISVAEVEADLERVRAQGFAESLEEFVEGMCSVAAPVFDGSGNVYGAFSVCLRAQRYQAVRTDARKAVLKAADDATRILASEELRYG